MGWKHFYRDYLSFSRRERIGVIAIVLAIVVTWFLPELLTATTKRETQADTSWITMIKNLEVNTTDTLQSRLIAGNADKEEDDYSFQKPAHDYSVTGKGELFYFDPNSLTAEGWQKLGLRKKTIQTIMNYIKKGGHFKKPEDLQTIYGLHADEWRRLAPFIKIEQSYETKSNKVNSPGFYTKPISAPGPRYSIIDVNTADTNAFISLPGIGNKLAARIVSFRDKLGGFYTIDQVKEIYGLADSTFQNIRQYLKLENNFLRKLNINTATKDDLKTHPYIRWNLANAIIEYRNTHGNYSGIDDLKKITIITEEIYNKIFPYLIL